MKTDQKISSPNQAAGKPFRGQGDNCPHIPKKILEVPPAFLTLYQQQSEFTMKKNKKTRIMTIKTRTTTNKMLDAMY